MVKDSFDSIFDITKSPSLFIKAISFPVQLKIKFAFFSLWPLFIYLLLNLKEFPKIKFLK